MHGLSHQVAHPMLYQMLYPMLYLEVSTFFQTSLAARAMFQTTLRLLDLDVTPIRSAAQPHNQMSDIESLRGRVRKAQAAGDRASVA